MKTLMIEANERNLKLVNKYHLTAKEFCGWLNVTGNSKIISKLAKLNKVVLY